MMWIHHARCSINIFLSFLGKIRTKVWEERFSFLANLLSVQSSLLLSKAPQTFSPQGGVSVASNYPNFFISCLSASPARPRSTSARSLTPSPKISDWAPKIKSPWLPLFCSRQLPIFHQISSPSQFTSYAAAQPRRLSTAFICNPGCSLTSLLKYLPFGVLLTHGGIIKITDPEAGYSFNVHVRNVMRP